MNKNEYIIVGTWHFFISPKCREGKYLFLRDIIKSAMGRQKDSETKGSIVQLLDAKNKLLIRLTRQSKSIIAATKSIAA